MNHSDSLSRIEIKSQLFIYTIATIEDGRGQSPNFGLGAMNYMHQDSQTRIFFITDQRE